MEKLLYNNIMVNIEITIRNVCFVCVYLQIFKAFLILKSRQKIDLQLISEMSERNVYYINFSCPNYGVENSF